MTYYFPKKILGSCISLSDDDLQKSYDEFRKNLTKFRKSDPRPLPDHRAVPISCTPEVGSNMKHSLGHDGYLTHPSPILYKGQKVQNLALIFDCSHLYLFTGWVEWKFNIPSNKLQIISGVGFYKSKNPMNSINTLKEDRVLSIRLRSRQVHPTVLQ